MLVPAEVVEQVGDVDVGRLQELGQEALKGFDEPVSVYEALATAGRIEWPPRSAPEQELQHPQCAATGSQESTDDSRIPD